VDPSLRSDPRVRRLVEALRRYTEAAEKDEDFSTWLLKEADDEELTTLLAHLINAEGPELTEATIRKQLTVTLTEQWRNQARRLTGQIQQAEQRGDDEAVATLQRELSDIRSRRPDY
jgi:hypothetical protein